MNSGGTQFSALCGDRICEVRQSKNSMLEFKKPRATNHNDTITGYIKNTGCEQF